MSDCAYEGAGRSPTRNSRRRSCICSVGGIGRMVAVGDMVVGIVEGMAMEI